MQSTVGLGSCSGHLLLASRSLGYLTSFLSLFTKSAYFVWNPQTFHILTAFSTSSLCVSVQLAFQNIGLTFSHTWCNLFHFRKYLLQSWFWYSVGILHSSFSHPQIGQACSLVFGSSIKMVNSPSLGASLPLLLPLCFGNSGFFYCCSYHAPSYVRHFLWPLPSVFSPHHASNPLLWLTLTDLKSNVVCPRTSSLTQD